MSFGTNASSTTDTLMVLPIDGAVGDEPFPLPLHEAKNSPIRTKGTRAMAQGQAIERTWRIRGIGNLLEVFEACHPPGKQLLLCPLARAGGSRRSDAVRP